MCCLNKGLKKLMEVVTCHVFCKYCTDNKVEEVLKIKIIAKIIVLPSEVSR